MLVINEMYDEWVFPKRKWLGVERGYTRLPGSYDLQEWSELDLADLVGETETISRCLLEYW